ncbi:MAG: histidine phosphatase family protein [Burkholderiales bacterium]|jgi:probable phosphoglycerate mutase|nr:histidine phosphatase family protein [Burkholderiales bacterium]
MSDAGAATTRLLVVRHGETEWNAQHRIQGHLDSPLTARGEAQARALAAALAREAPLAAIYASDLARTQATAAPTATATALPIRIDARLRERHLGCFQTLTFAEADARWPALFARYRARDPHIDLDGGESLVTVRDRVAAALHAIGARHVGDTVLVVTHGGVLDQVYRLATGMPLEAPRTFDIENAALNRVDWVAGTLALVAWGEPIGDAGAGAPAEF